MGCFASAPVGADSALADQAVSVMPDEVNRLLDKWAIGHVLLIRKRFLASKSPKSVDLDLEGFRRMFAELESALPSEVVAAAFKQFDTRKAGSLTFRDICFGLATSCISSWEVRARFVFCWFSSEGRFTQSHAETLLACIGLVTGDGSASFLSDLSPKAPEDLERVQSCVTAFSAIADPVRDPSPAELELFSMFTAHECISFDSFLHWSAKHVNALFRLLELFEIVPSPDKERRLIRDILKSPDSESSWFVISYKWVQLWRAYVGWADGDLASLGLPGSPRVHAMLSTVDMVSCTSSVLQERLGERPPAINNSDLEGELKGALRANLVELHDYVLLPEAAWRLLAEWYGGGPSFPRKRTDSRVELYPPLVLVVMCGDHGVPVRHFTKRFFASKSDSCKDLLSQLSVRLIGKETECRLWHRRAGEEWELVSDSELRIDDFVDSSTTDAGTFMLEQHRAGGWPRDKLDASASGDLQVGDRVDAKHGVDWKAATIVDVTEDSVKVHFANEQSRHDAWLSYDGDEIAPLGTYTALEGEATVRRSSRGKCWGRRRPQGMRRVASTETIRGPKGLENIGNTCFMNATLQCLSCTPFLRDFFIANEGKGVQGKLAGEFASLLADMLHSRKRAVAPRGFKKALEKHAPRFAGYEHQDAHELLAVVLDGLHEDLNRGVVAECAEPTTSATAKWKKHRAEHASVIADLFDGQLRVSTTCSVCGFVSDVFEAVRYAMVPVPVTDFRSFSAVMVPTNGGGLTQVSVVVRKSGFVNDVLVALSVDPERVIVAEIYMSRIHRIIDASTPIAEFRSDDQIFIFPLDVVGSQNRVRAVSDLTDLGQSRVRAGSEFTEGPTRGRLGSVMTELESEPEVVAQIVHRRQVLYRRHHRVVTKREIVGTPLVMSVSGKWTYFQLAQAIRNRVGGQMGSFTISQTAPDGITCAVCDNLACEGCPLPPTSTQRIHANGNWLYLAIDWSTAPPVPVILSAEKKMLAATGKTPGKTTGRVSLYDCLDAYTATECLDGENKWFCERCDSKTVAERKTNWERTPDVLVVLLKRFQYTHAGVEKLTVPINFPVADLALRPGSAMYDLYGVVNHFGSLGSGHYTAVCLDQTTSQWSILNDHQVVAVAAEEVEKSLTHCAKSCYVLFYKRQDTRPANVINYAPLHV